MTWTVKAVDRNIWVGTSVFALPFLCLISLIIYFYMTSQSELATSLLIGSPFFIFIYFKINFEKTVFVYRATEERLEICQWQDIPDLVFTFLKVFPFLIIGIILMALISNPALSIAALAGPALVGILLASVGGDSNYKAIYKRFRQHDFTWDNLDRALLDPQKGLLGLSVSSPNNVIHDDQINFDNPDDHRYLKRIYFRKDQEAAVLELFRNKMPAGATLVERNYKYDFVG
ncbi:hypothetical protein [Halopseudomonas bauzanensis]|uniref:Uncharacterized protein n=1 Tax=Halopseudomonas bauzanensis TaxID=653930 RepID=A0A4U0YSW0_9GAMM|nr:hypothetical protein [Halopseudomonas bauzanensis]TKA92153.1 hypothetical protein FA869_07080 [Halopseudomonas bauzanensis]